MMLTETDAKERWCPFARAAESSNVDLAVNRQAGNFDACGNETVILMGRWRCIDDEWLTEEPNDPTESPPSTRHRRGYCGLAGKP